MLETFVMWCYHKMLTVSWMENKSNEQVVKDIEQVDNY